MKKYKNYLTILVLFTLLGCQESKKDIEVSANELHDAMQKLTDVIVHDIFSPPVASRIYAYPSIAAYEILALNDSTYRSLAGQLRGFESIPAPAIEIDHDVAAVDAFLLLGKALIFSENRIEEYRQNWHQHVLDRGLSKQFHGICPKSARSYHGLGG